MEATARGLFVHQMAGILPDRARELYQIPADAQPLTGLAIGYLGSPDALPEAYRKRDLSPRQRKPLVEFVFAGQWGTTADLATADAKTAQLAARTVSFWTPRETLLLADPSADFWTRCVAVPPSPR